MWRCICAGRFDLLGSLYFSGREKSNFIERGSYVQYDRICNKLHRKQEERIKGVSALSDNTRRTQNKEVLSIKRHDIGWISCLFYVVKKIPGLYRGSDRRAEQE